ncbi:hypothetical protein REPUB_Repub19eG0109200 [Reevesia pubescens]
MLRVNGKEWPTMKEVTHELEGLKAMVRHPWVKSNLQGKEDEYLLGELCNTYDDDAISSVIGYDNINNRITFELEGAQ